MCILFHLFDVDMICIDGNRVRIYELKSLFEVGVVVGASSSRFYWEDIFHTFFFQDWVWADSSFAWGADVSLDCSLGGVRFVLQFILLPFPAFLFLRVMTFSDVLHSLDAGRFFFYFFETFVGTLSGIAFAFGAVSLMGLSYFEFMLSFLRDEGKKMFRGNRYLFLEFIKFKMWTFDDKFISFNRIDKFMLIDILDFFLHIFNNLIFLENLLFNPDNFIFQISFLFNLTFG